MSDSKVKTRLAVVVQSETGEGSKVFDLHDPFDTVIERLYPLQQPSSALEHRTNMVHFKEDGGRLAVNPNHVAWLEELDEDDD